MLLGGLAAAAAAMVATLAGCQPFGERAHGERLARMERSPQWHGDRFENPQPMWSDTREALLHGLSGVPDVEPSAPVPVARTDPAMLATVPASGLRVTWFGHSSTLLQIDGVRLLDLALIEAGQYDAAWPDWHLGPEQAVLSAQRVRAKAMMPVHWGLFRLAPHGWTEPVERVLAAARCTGLPVITPRPGQTIEPTALRPGDSTRWWPHARWSGASRTPIVATLDGVAAHRIALPSCLGASTSASAASAPAGAQAASER